MKTKEEIEKIEQLAKKEIERYRQSASSIENVSCNCKWMYKFIARKVWYDIFNNDTLSYNSFEDYFKNEFKNI
jgi:hypothetical protein